MRRLRGLRRQDGQTMAEYGVVLAVITPAIVLALVMLADAVDERVMRVVGFLGG